jgi:surface protein
MSVGYISDKAVGTKDILANKPKYVPVPTPIPYQRPSDWLTLPAVSSSDQKFVGLIAVYDDDTNWVALSATTSAGTYTVDWGDGTTETVASGVVAQHAYTYSSISPSTNSTRGYRQAIVTVTPTTANLTDINLQQRYTEGYPGTWTNSTVRWLDIRFGGPNLTSFTISQSASNPFMPLLEQIEVVSLGVSTTDFSNTFRNLYKLQNLIWPSTVSITSGSNAFDNCFALKNAPNLTFSGASPNLSEMFDACRSLTYVPVYDFSNCTNVNLSSMFSACSALTTISGIISGDKVTSTDSMFSNCVSLVSIPTFDTSNVTSMASMFANCTGLTAAPYLDTKNVTNMTGMFNDCRSLISVPTYDMQSTTSTASLFLNCSALTSVPKFTNIGNITNAVSMFSGCTSLYDIPAFDTSNVTNASSMFSSTEISQAPNIDLSNVTNMNNMFANCRSLVSVPSYNTSNVTSMISTFNGCSNLVNLPTLDASKVTIMQQTFTGCTALQQVTLSNTSNVTQFTATFSSCNNLRTAPTLNTSKGTSVQNMFTNCSTLESIPNYNLGNCTQFTGFLTGANELSEFNATDIIFNIVLNNKFTKLALENVMGNLRANLSFSRIITLANNPGTDTPLTKTATWTSTSNVMTMANTVGVTVGTQVTAAANVNIGYAATLTSNKVSVASTIGANTMISFVTVTTSNIAANTLYYTSNIAGSGPYTYDLSTTPGGTPITFTNGTANMRVNLRVTGINTNANVILNAWPAGAGTGANVTTRQLNTNIATFKRWEVSG